MEEVKKTVEERSKEILVRQMKVFLSSKVVKLFDDPEVIEIIANKHRASDELNISTGKNLRLELL